MNGLCRILAHSLLTAEIHQILVAVRRRRRVWPVLWLVVSHDSRPSRLLLHAVQAGHHLLCTRENHALGEVTKVLVLLPCGQAACQVIQTLMILYPLRYAHARHAREVWVKVAVPLLGGVVAC